MEYTQKEIKKIARHIKSGEVAVLPTDTVYGLCASAFDKKVVSRVYHLRQRDIKKPCIILISSLADLDLFYIKISNHARKILRKLWPNPVSVVLPRPQKEFSYLHKGTKTLAFRIPQDPFLKTLLKRTGPLIAPSANKQGKLPAKTVQQAIAYFSDKVSVYVNGGTKNKSASSVIALSADGVYFKIVRRGPVSSTELKKIFIS